MNNDNATKFLNLYNKLDDVLSHKYNRFDNNYSFIAKYSNELMLSSNYKIYERGRILNEIRQIRNAYVHDFDMNKDNLLNISEKTINFLQNEINNLTNPKNALNICTPFNKLLFAKLGDSVIDILSIMLEKGFLQFPIIDQYSHLLGVISPNSIMQYIAYGDKDVTSLKVNDLYEYYPLDKHVSEYYMFVKEKESVQIVSSLFDKMYEKGKRLVMIFVTKDGRNDQPILGVITPYDILKLDAI